MMGVKLQTLNVSLRDSEEGPESNLWLPDVATVENKKILIVDDINDSGATFEWIKKDWDSSELPNGCKWDNIKFATLVHNEASVTKTDYAFISIDKSKEDTWIVFPWEKND
jgi:hypoxanthine phosphoribosyltransferase